MTWSHALLILLTILVILTPRERDGWKRSLSTPVPPPPRTDSRDGNAEVSVAHPGTGVLNDQQAAP